MTADTHLGDPETIGADLYVLTEECPLQCISVCSSLLMSVCSRMNRMQRDDSDPTGPLACRLGIGTLLNFSAATAVTGLV